MSETESPAEIVAEHPGESLEEHEARMHEIATHPELLPMLPGELRPHPKPREYVLIAVVLCILTGIEVGLYYLEGDINDNLLIAMLAVLAATKFILVVSWYMHMRTDQPFFRRIFSVGVIGALIVYGIAILTFASTLLAEGRL